MKKNILTYIFLLLIVPLAFLCTIAKSNNVPYGNPRLESGYIQISSDDNLFYLLIRSNTAEAPLIIYLAGGPGASSVAPMFMGNGPWNLDHPFNHDTNYKLTKNKWSWNKLANIVYLDQPKYTGYSYGKSPYLTSIKSAGVDFIAWLQLFYKRYPEFRQRSLYIAGESFAGEYIPEFSHQILQFNKMNPDNTIPLKGLLLQSPALSDDRFGLDVAPKYQLEYLCSQKMLSNKACQSESKNSLRQILEQCINDIATSKHIPASTVKISDLYLSSKISKPCAQYLGEVALVPEFKSIKIPDSSIFPIEIRGKTIKQPVNKLQFSKSSQVREFLKYSPNPFNVKLRCQSSGGYPPSCFDQYKITNFFNDPSTKSWLGNGIIPDKIKWEFAKFPVAFVLELNYNFTPIDYYTEALRNNLKVILIFGKNDWQINYFAAQALADKITREAYRKPLFNLLPAPPSSLKVLTNDRGQRIGEYLELNNISFAQIDNAGHMIGIDQPEASYKLLSAWLKK